MKLENLGSSLRVKRGLLATRGNAGVPQHGECRVYLTVFHSEGRVCKYAMSTVPLMSAPILVLGLHVDGSGQHARCESAWLSPLSGFGLQSDRNDHPRPIHAVKEGQWRPTCRLGPDVGRSPEVKRRSAHESAFKVDRPKVISGDELVAI